ncbi:MAG: pectate lyase [Bacilli bacterium]|jgi:hypothetical protein|nr:pectate lyase [Bacilli bacterium]
MNKKLLEKTIMASMMCFSLLSSCGEVTSSKNDSAAASSSPVSSQAGSSRSSLSSDGNETGFTHDDAPANSLTTVEGNPIFRSKNYELVFQGKEEGFGLNVVKMVGEVKTFYQEQPAYIKIRSKGTGVGIESFKETFLSAPYKEVLEKNYGYLAKGYITSAAGSSFYIEDNYFLNQEDVFVVNRTVKVLAAVKDDAGFASLIRMNSADDIGDYTKFDYFLPSILYKNSDSIVGGAICSNLDLDKVYVKETRMGMPMAFLRSHTSNESLSLCHYDPQIDGGDSAGGGQAGEINETFAYASLGYTIMPKLSVDFCYPCSEGPNTYDSGQGWARRYHPVKVGFSHNFEVGIIPDGSATYNESMVSSFKKGFTMSEKKVYDVKMDDIYSYGIKIFQDKYLEYTSGGKVVSAGLPWSLNLLTGESADTISFQMGFVGQQIPAGYQLYRYGLENKDSATKTKGLNMLNFWTGDMTMGSYFPSVWWDPDNSATGGQRRSYPSFLRCMIDGMEGLIDAYKTSVRFGEANATWLDRLTTFGTHLVDKQNDDGSFYRAYTIGGVVDTDNSNPCFQGTSKLNTPVAIRFLAKMYELTGDAKYKTAALKAADFCYTNLYEALGKYVGGTPDNPNTVDKEAATFAMYGFNAAYNLSKDEKYLKAAEHATICTLSWTYCYDFKVSSDSLESSKINVFKEGGVIGFSIIATGHSGADNFSAFTHYETYKMYLETGDEFYKMAALMLQNDTKLSNDYDGRMNFAYRAMGPEATAVADFSFRTVGVWLPWSTIANLDPLTQVEDTLGNKDLSKVTMSFTEQQQALASYGSGGKLNGGN